MEPASPSRPDRLHDEDFDVRGARNFSKMEKLESERTQTTTSRSVTTNGGATRYMNGDDSPTSEILVDNALEDRTFATADDSDDWRSRKTEQRSDLVEQRSDTQAKRYGAAERRSAAAEQRSGTNEQEYSTRSLGRRERNVAAAEMAYRMAGLPADVEFSQASKRSKVVNADDGQPKPRGGLRGLEDTADMIVEDTMEQAIDALYGKRRRRKMAKDAKTTSLDRRAGMTATTDGRAGYDTTLSESKTLGRTTNQTTSKNQSRKKAVSYLRVKEDDEDNEEDLDVRRPASADGRLVADRVEYTAVRRARAGRPLPHTAASKSRYQASYMSPPTSHYQRRTAADVTAATRQVSGYASETEPKQSSRRTNRRQFSGDDSDFSTTVEIRNPSSVQLQAAENGGYTSDESETWNMHSSSKRRVPTLTKGMVTKILHGDRPQPATAQMSVSEVDRADVQTATSPVQFTTSPPPSINLLSSPTVYRDGQLSAVVPVGTAAESRWTSAVDDNFLLQQAPGYQSQYSARQTAGYGTGGTGRSTPTSIQTMVENDERPSSLYTAFSNEPIVVANLDDDYSTRSTSMRRTQSLFALDAMSPVSAGIGGTGRSLTPAYSSRPDIRMTNRQVLNLYLFNRTAPADGGRDRTAELETVTHTMSFDDEAHRIRTGNKHTQTSARPEPVPPKPAKRRKPTPSRVTEETVIVKPSITETRETEIVGDVFADRRRMSLQEPEHPVVQATNAREELPRSEESEEEILETTVVEEKEQRIEMTIREDLEFSLQRSRATAKAVAGSTDEGKVEPWWIPDTFEAFVERKRQKITQTKDIENKDDHSKRIDTENNARTSNDTYDVAEMNSFENHSNNYHETDSGKQSTRRNQTAAGGNIRIPIFLENRYQSPMHGMTSPSSNLVRSKMTTHSEPEMNRRNQYYLGKRDKYYGSLFDDSHRKPLSANDRSNENSLPVSSSSSKKQQQTSSVEVPELDPLALGDDEESDYSSTAGQEPRSSVRRYVSSYSHYISPPISSGDREPSVAGMDQHFRSSRSATGVHASRQPLTSATDAVFPTPRTISLPNVEADHGKGGTRGSGDDQLPASLDHFDRVLTEIEEELPPPPPPPPLPGGATQARNTSSQSSQRHYVATSSSTDTPPTQKKSKPPPPEKSWKRSGPSPAKPGKLYSSKERPGADTTASGTEKPKSSASRSERQSTSSKATGKEISSASSAAAGRQQQPAGSDYRRQLGDHSYISLSLTEPLQRQDQRRKIEVVKHGQHAEPGAFRYGWTSQEHRTRKDSPPPGRYQLRHSRYPADDYDTAATAF